jgi:general secretion pathway protein E
LSNIARLLVERGIISETDAQEAAAMKAAHGGTLSAAVVRLGAAAEEEAQAAIGAALHIPLLKENTAPSVRAVEDAIDRLKAPLSWFISRDILPWFDGDQLHVAARAVYEPDIQDAIEQWSHVPAQLYLTTADVLAPFWAALRNQSDGPLHSGEQNAARLREMAQEGPIIDLVNQFFQEALTRQSSDLHIEPFENELRIRFRVDGVLQAWRSQPRSVFEAVASRIKLLSGIDIAERRLPQDGRQRVRIAGQDIDLRVSTLPTKWGQSIVLRLLGNTRGLPDLAGLGMASDHIETLRDILRQQHGMILLTGPTGSGKTTTVYRLISEMNDGARKIVTVEDPIEMDLPGVLQMQVRQDIGLSFASGLRAILRQDPDIIFVGEIRDQETAAIAVQAALTGHLVISTLHTKSALGAVWRLLDLGVEPFLLAEVLLAVVGERLVRRTCAACGSAGAQTDGSVCGACRGVGYRGRLGVFEIARITPELRTAIRSRQSEESLAELTASQGVRTLFQDAMLKARDGLTSAQEAQRTCL